MRVALITVLLLAGCLDVVDHTPEGSCLHDSDCACGFDCNVRDAGTFLFCGMRTTHGCTLDSDCHAQGLSHCVDVARDGGACGYKICQ